MFVSHQPLLPSGALHDGRVRHWFSIGLSGPRDGREVIRGLLEEHGSVAPDEPRAVAMWFSTFVIIRGRDADQFTYLLHEDVPVLAASYGWGADLDLCHRLLRSFITLRVELVLPVHVRLDSRRDRSGGSRSFAECLRGITWFDHDNYWRILI